MRFATSWVLAELRRRSDGSNACEALVKRAEFDLTDDRSGLSPLTLISWWLQALEVYLADSRPEVARAILDGELDPTGGE
ncbi:MAG: hypothetical protein WD960_11700 [Gemmatimonadota bacterium]